MNYDYNGLGDRLSQTVDGITTSCTLDLNPSPSLRAGSGLTQVLADGTNTYLYGNGRIAQVGAATEYFLGDALGSVRQMADGTGAVTLSRSYEPYGTEASSVGSGLSNYGFTGEMTDPTEFIHLRARYYASSEGSFITRDPSRLEANLYLYASANPINRSDPTGLISGGDGLASFVACFDLHSLSHGVYSSDGLVIYATVDDAISTCKRAYSKDAWNPTWFDFSRIPESAHDLMGWYLYEQGNEHMWFDGNSALTKELARSTFVSDIRLKYYLQGDIIGQNLKEFGYGAFIRSVSKDSLGSMSNLSLPISFFLGSFNYQVVTLGDRIGFRIDNRTDLESGTHIAGRFPGEKYGGSIEELLASGDINGGDLLFNVINQNFNGKKVVSILRARSRPETAFERPLGGGNFEQTYTWTEQRNNCFWWLEVLSYIPDTNSKRVIDPWPDYWLYTQDVR
jgi:RHS repeat-associated protein